MSLALRPELLNRIDEIVEFRELGLPEIERIVAIHVESLAGRLGARDVRMHLTEAARRFLAEESASAGSGARYVQRTVARFVATPLSNALLSGEIAAGATANVDVHDEILVVRAA